MSLQFRFVLALALAGFMAISFSCARDQELTSIGVVPDHEIFGAPNIPVFANAGATVQLRALGHYIHPPVTKDITETGGLGFEYRADDHRQLHRADHCNW